jgi:hypothetical protein
LRSNAAWIFFRFGMIRPKAFEVGSRDQMNCCGDEGK